MQSEITTVNLNAQAAAYVCPQCQAENRANAKYCRKCGVPRIESRVVSEGDRSASIFVIETPAEQLSTELFDQCENQAEDRCEALHVDEDTHPKLILSSDLGITSQIATEPCITADSLLKAEPGTTSIFSNIVWETTPQIASEQSTTQRQCASCQTRIRVTDKFCIWCGSKQPASTSLEFKTCSFCLVPIPAKAGYCSLCGITVEANYNQASTLPANTSQAAATHNSGEGSVARDTTDEPVFFYEDDWLTKN